MLNEDNPDGGTMIQLYPNPSRNYFNMNIKTASNSDDISIRLFDAVGRMVEVRNSISGSQVVRMGDKLGAGIYFAEAKQGNSTNRIKLVKIE